MIRKHKLIKKIIEDVYAYTPAERAAMALRLEGITENDFFGLKGIEDTQLINTRNALRDLERNFRKQGT